MKTHFKTLTAVLAVLSMVSVLSVGIFLGQRYGEQHENTFTGPCEISVSAFEQKEVAADRALFTVSAETICNTAQEASGKTSSLINSALNALTEAFSLTEEDLKTGRIGISPAWTWKDGERILLGQKAEQSVEVIIREPERAGEVYDLLSRYDGLSISNISLFREDVSETETEVRSMAMKEAIAIAEDYASALGMRIAGVKSVSAGGYQTVSPYLSAGNSYKAVMMDSSSVTTEYHAGDVTVKAEVSAVFVLEPPDGNSHE